LKPNIVIALRFFLESKRSMLLSALGVMFGVGFFICGQAQTQGFQTYFIQTILGSKGAVIISERFQNSYTEILEQKNDSVISVNNPQTRKYYPGISDAYRVIRTLMTFPNVAACSPIAEGNVVLRSGFRNEVAVLHGIDLDLHLKATDFEKQIVDGTISDFRNNQDALAVGSLLRDKLELQVGQNVFLIGPGADSKRFKLTTIYETGVNVIDEKRIYCHRRAAQGVLQMPYLTSQILVKLNNPDRAPQNAEAFEDLLSHRARPWQEREKGNLQIFSTLRISAAIGVSCIILLAGFGIFNILTMAVLQKTKEISILRAMGYSRYDIEAIFLWQGSGVAILGVLGGWALGAVMTLGVAQIPIKIRGIFKADHFMVEWTYEHYLVAAILGIFSVLIASYIPARRASLIEPVDVLRGTSN
jgi:lipoprotein-releasing system permease protein